MKDNHSKSRAFYLGVYFLLEGSANQPVYTGVTPPAPLEFGPGTQHTGLYATNDKPLNLDNQFHMLMPDFARGLSWVMGGAQVKNTPYHFFKWQEDAPHPMWVEYTGATETSQGATIDIANYKRLVGGHRILNVNTLEVVRVTDTPSNSTVTVDRNYGSAGAPFMTKGDKLRIMAPSREQGAAMADFRTFGRLGKEGFTSIVSYTVAQTGTAAAERLITGEDPFQYELKNQWLNLKRQMETEFFYGGQVNDAAGTGASTSYPLTATDGLVNIVETHKFDFGGSVLNRMDLWDILLEMAKDNPNQNSAVNIGLLCSWEFIATVNLWALDKTVYEQPVNADGIQIFKLLTPRGTIDLIPIDMLSEDPTLAGHAFIVDRSKISYRPLVGATNRGISYIPRNSGVEDKVWGEILGEYGWQFKHEQAFGFIENIGY